MKKEKDILAGIPASDGMSVPEGFFADFATRMADTLPKTEFEQSAHSKPAPPASLWQRIRPYTYMAAMFAGVWCMLKLFTSITGNPAAFQPSDGLARALDNEYFVNEYIIDDISQWDIMDEMMNDGFDLTLLDDDHAADQTDQLQKL